MAAEPVRTRRLSLRAKLVRLGTRLFIKPASRGRSLAASRKTFRFMARLAPPPPRGTKTTHIDAGGVPAESIVRPGALAGRHVLYLHGGGYCLGSPANYRHFSWRIADAARAPVLTIDYRLAPEYPFPGALEDAVKAYRWLLDRGAQEIVVMGESAGGGLTLALLMKLHDDRLPLPHAAVAISPWTDLALTGVSLTENADADPMLNTSDLPEFAANYVAGGDSLNPYISPLYGDPSGLPPVLMLVGSDEILRDDAVRMGEKLCRANPRSDLQVWPRMVHAWPLFATVMPEARAAVAEIGAFVERQLGAPGARRRQESPRAESPETGQGLP